MSRKPTYEELEQRIQELEYSESELKLNFERVQKISRIGSWEWDPLTDKVTYADIIFEIFGISKADFKGNFASMLVELVHPEDRAKVHEAAEKARATGVGSDVTYRIIKPDGEIRWIHAVGEFVSEDGKLTKMIGTNQDVTEQKLAESALKDSENKYRVLTENTSLGIGVSNGFEMIYANQSILDMFMIDSIDRFNEKPPLEYLTPESKKRTRERIEKLEQGKKISDEFAIDIIRSDKELRTLELYFADITIKGESCRLITFNDITKKKQTEETLRVNEYIIDSASSIIATCDFDTNMTYANPLFYKECGYKQEEVIGKSFAQFWSVGENLDEIMNTLTKEGKWKGELKVNKKDGSQIDVQVSAATIFDNNQNPIGLMSSSIDITERKRTLKDLKKSETTLTAILENASELFLMVDSNYILSIINPIGKLIFKKTMNIDIEVGQNILEIILPALKPSWKERYDRALRGEQFVIEDEYIENGVAFYTEVSFTPVRDKNEIRGVSVFARDISERKRSEYALHASEVNLKKAQTISQMGHWKLNPNTMEVEGSNELLRIFGLTNEELTLDTFAGVVHPDDLEYDMKHIKRGLEQGVDWDIEHRLLQKDGTIKWVHAIGEAETDVNGNVTQLVGTVQDITDRKMVSNALQESEERFRLVVTNSLPIIDMFDLEGKIILSEGKMLKNVGLVPGEVVGQNVFELYKDFPVLINAFKNALNGEIFRGVVDFGGLFFESLYSPNRNSSGEIIGVIGISMDITSQKKSEEEKLEFEKNILHTQKLESLGVLAGGIAHDFNNILMSILGYADLAFSELSPISPIREYVQAIMDSSKNAASLVKQMLAYSGKGMFSLEPIDLNLLIEDTVQMLNVSISKNTVLRFNFSHEPVFIEGDPSQIRQIIMNLVINASDAIGKKSGVIALDTGTMYCDQEYIEATGFKDQITRKEKLQPGMYVFLEVSDTGIGMSKETISRIFEPFFTTKFTGRGLGLSAVMGIVGGHHGLVNIYSEEGKGSNFKILFPLFESDQILKSDSDSLTGLDDDWPGQGTFLIVDDEEAIRTIGKHIIEKLGFDVLTASDGREAIEIFKKHSDEIVCVLLDLTMPHKDGAEVFKEVRRQNPNAKVVLTSGYNEQSATQQFVGKGLAGFIQKPYVASELVEKIKEVMGK